MRPNGALLAVYRGARYSVQLPDRPILILRIGDPASALDTMAERSGMSCWALLHAGCPRSAPWPARLNDARLRMLQALLRHQRRPFWTAAGHAPDDRWSEAGVLALFPDLRPADALACRFGQHGIVWGAVGVPATLRLYGVGWPPLPSKPSANTRSGGGSSG